MERHRRAELMDQPSADPAELMRSLNDLRSVNRWLGGRRSAVRHVLSIAGTVEQRPVVVLDVGTGAADIPLALVDRSAEVGIQMRVIAVDMHSVTLAAARAATSRTGEIAVVGGDALDLPLASDSVDIAMINTALHHFGEGDARRVLEELKRVARSAVVVTDLSRSRAALAGANLLAATVWRGHPITRHDGPWSVRSAFTPGEMRALGERVFGDTVTVRREPIFRLSMTARERGRMGRGAAAASESSGRAG